MFQKEKLFSSLSILNQGVSQAKTNTTFPFLQAAAGAGSNVVESVINENKVGDLKKKKDPGVLRFKGRNCFSVERLGG